jgi:hypothetical protein
MSAVAIESKRVVRTYRQSIEAAAEVVFPLLCPVREAEWLEGWAHTMVYSASGLIEEGAVFTTASEGEADTVWIVSRHDAAAGRVEFSRVTPGSRTCHLKIALSPCSDGHTHVDVSYAYTALTGAGEQFLEAWTSEAFLEGMIFWERSMNHYLRTGGRLARGST